MHRIWTSEMREIHGNESAMCRGCGLVRVPSRGLRCQFRINPCAAAGFFCTGRRQLMKAIKSAMQGGGTRTRPLIKNRVSWSLDAVAHHIASILPCSQHAPPKGHPQFLMSNRIKLFQSIRNENSDNICDCQLFA